MEDARWQSQWSPLPLLVRSRLYAVAPIPRRPAAWLALIKPLADFQGLKGWVVVSLQGSRISVPLRSEVQACDLWWPKGSLKA